MFACVEERPNRHFERNIDIARVIIRLKKRKGVNRQAMYVIEELLALLLCFIAVTALGALCTLVGINFQLVALIFAAYAVFSSR